MRFITALLLATTTLTYAQSTELLGSKYLFEQLAKKLNAPARNADSTLEADFLKKIETFKAATGLSAEESANQWIALMDEYLKIQTAKNNRFEYNDFNDREKIKHTIYTALPAVESWEIIKEKLSSRTTSRPIQDELLKLHINVLCGDKEGQTRSLQKLNEHAKKYIKDDYSRSPFTAIELKLNATNVDPKQQVDQFEKMLKTLESTKQTERHIGYRKIDIPNLVELCEAKRAESLIKRALELPVRIDINNNKTSDLVTKIALDHVKTAKNPNWEIIRGIKDAQLAAAYLKKFGYPENNYNTSGAISAHLIQLIIDQKFNEVEELYNKHTKNISLDRLNNHIKELNKADQEKLFQFYEYFLNKHPDTDLWKSYIQLASQIDKSSQVIQFLKQTIAKTNIDDDKKIKAKEHLVYALIADNQLDEGSELIRMLLKKPKPAEEAVVDEDTIVSHDSTDEYIDLAYSLATIGQLKQKPELIDEAIQGAIQINEKRHEQNSAAFKIALLMMYHKRDTEAERFLIEHISNSLDSKKNQQKTRCLLLLVHLYNQHSKYSDALAIIDQSTAWGIETIDQIDESSINEFSSYAIIANTLLHNNRAEEAKAILQRAIISKPNDDSAYELLLKLMPDASF